MSPEENLCRTLSRLRATNRALQLAVKEDVGRYRRLLERARREVVDDDPEYDPPYKKVWEN